MNTINFLVNAIMQVLVFSLLPFLWWLLTAAKKESFLSWLGLEKPVLKVSVYKLIIVAVSVVVIDILLMVLIMTTLLSQINTATTQFANGGLGTLPQILIFGVIQTGLSEEILFRGFLGKRFISKFGFNIGNTIQAVLFGLLHGIPFWLLSGNIGVFILLALLPGAMGSRMDE